MAKGSRGGRRGGGGAGGGSLGSFNTGASNVPTNVSVLTDSEADQLRQLQDSMYDANTTAAVKMYISAADFDGQGHSMSQTMNYLLDNGVDLNTADINQLNKQFGLRLTPNDLASMQYANGMMSLAYHPIGKSIELQRGAHDDVLRDVFGISDYSTMTEGQLKKALVDQNWRNRSPMSTSYDINKNPFLGQGSGVSGGREVVYKIKAGANTGMLFGAKKQSEMILAPNTQWRITDVKYTGKTATPRGGRAKPQILIEMETF